MGPIPARAGEPSIQTPCWHSREAYPRSRGGTSACRLGWPAGSGLSPLARGNPQINPYRQASQGPIPARAGEPSGCAKASISCTAYPRSRWGTHSYEHYRDWVEGLSPLARGNLVDFFDFGLIHGPIPARAGDPHYLEIDNCLTRAYPRSRGGTQTNCPRH